MITMYDDGLRKAMEGRTTVEDVMRVAAADDGHLEDAGAIPDEAGEA
jgi:hypothetical protein